MDYRISDETCLTFNAPNVRFAERARNVEIILKGEMDTFVAAKKLCPEEMGEISVQLYWKSWSLLRTKTVRMKHEEHGAWAGKCQQMVVK